MENILESKSIFDNIRHIDEYGNEYWKARELQKVLEYKKWEKFNNVIQTAMIACKASKNNVLDHFPQVGKMVSIGSGAIRKQLDYKLSRYACYLIAQNADPRKEVVALAQTYFAVQTRKQELLESLSEDERRLDLRKKVKSGNLSLNITAVNSGVKRLAEFHNAGYKGLYNEETADDIFKRKKLRYRQDILDHMGSVELAANLFRITQTDDRLKKDRVDDEYKANSVHYDIGKNIRNVIKKNGGTMPEKLPTPNRSLKEIEKSNKKNIL